MYLIRGVLRCRKRAEIWNDTPGRTKAEVIDYLSTVEITDADLEATFGPHWRDVVTLVRQAASLTPEQVQKIQHFWVAALGAAWNTARAAAQDTAWDAIRGAADSAALAIVAQDHISSSDFRILMDSWQSIFPA